MYRMSIVMITNNIFLGAFNRRVLVHLRISNGLRGKVGVMCGHIMIRLMRQMSSHYFRYHIFHSKRMSLFTEFMPSSRHFPDNKTNRICVYWIWIWLFCVMSMFNWRQDVNTTVFAIWVARLHNAYLAHRCCLKFRNISDSHKCDCKCTIHLCPLMIESELIYNIFS